MVTKEVKEKILTMLDAGYTRIAIADRLGISDERLGYIIRVVLNHKITIKKHIRQTILSMNVDELNNVEINAINMSSVVTRLSAIYGNYENIPKNTPALMHVLEFTGAISPGRKLKSVDLGRAQTMLDAGIKKVEICNALNVGHTYISDKVKAGVLSDKKWRSIPNSRHLTLKEVEIE